MKKGFTLTELLVTIVILAVLAATAIPGFSKSRDKAAANQAIAYLRTIRVGEKMYFAKNATYIACADKATLKTNLGVEVTTENFQFNVVAGVATFSARALKGGAPANCTDANALCIDQDGVWSGGSSFNITQLNT